MQVCPSIQWRWSIQGYLWLLCQGRWLKDIKVSQGGKRENGSQIERYSTLKDKALMWAKVSLDMVELDSLNLLLALGNEIAMKNKSNIWIYLRKSLKFEEQ